MAVISTITDFVVYDNLLIQRTIDAIPSGQTVSTAWFTIKNRYSDLDTESVLEKVITSVLASSGIIEANVLNFFLNDTDTALLTPLAEYKYSIKLLLSNGQKFTPETGTIIGLPAVKRGST